MQEKIKLNIHYMQGLNLVLSDIKVLYLGMMMQMLHLPLRNMNIFFEACKKDLDSDKFFLQDYRTDEFYRWGYAKLRRNNSAFIRKGQEHMKYHNGICIDIFVLYNVPDSYLLRKNVFWCFLDYQKGIIF